MLRSPTGDLYGPWWHHPFVMFDVETTGLDPEKDRIVEMGFARFERGELVGQYGTLVYPDMLIPKEASEIHGISSVDVSSAPSFATAMARALNLCHGAWPAAYNADFDHGFWTAEMARAGLSGIPTPICNPSYQWLDPLVWVRSREGCFGNKLTAVAERYNIALENAHRATDDAISAGKLLVALRGVMPRVTIIELLRRQRYFNGQHREEIEEWLGKKRASGR